MIDNTINDDKTIADGIGTMLAGRYHILRRLGQGGMGSVWLAEDRQLDNRKVAIKMLPSIVVTDKRAYQQLKSEALVSLKLVHPNIVTLRAFEENNGAPFLVMDYIEGQTLSDYLAVKGKLSEAETIKLLKPIAAALDYAHGEKVIHRDVKPSNIIIRKDGHPFILDFGIAREIQESMTRVTGRTISGTLLYMSPEQLRGAPPAPAQDVYSFAAMCYECLKGEPPFTRGEIAHQILNEKPATLTGDSRFIASIMSGLYKEPERRPRNCALLLCQNKSIRSHGYSGVRSSAQALNWRTGSRRRVMFMSLAVIIVLVVGSICWSASRYNSRKNTKQFLTYFEAKKFDEAAKLIGKIDDSDACVKRALGEMYWGGKGVSKDKILASILFHDAAECGDVRAQMSLGIMYKFGNGVPKNEKASAMWFRRAAEQGDALAQSYVGSMYLDGCGVTKDAAEAIKWLSKAAEQGDKNARDLIGIVYAKEAFATKDDAEAVRLLRKGAESGSPIAQANLAAMYAEGRGVPQDEGEAMKWYRKAAEQGDALSQNNVGVCYEFGRGVLKDNRAAANWYLRAALQNYSVAQNNLGRCYLEGIGVDVDMDEAVKWFHKAAEQGHAVAQRNLGICCLRTGDEEQAVKWFCEAAEQEDAGAQLLLGDCFKDGIGTKKNVEEAVRWYRKAAKHGQNEAQQTLRGMGLSW